MATMQELRAEAKRAGVPTSEIRSAESTAELQGLIAGQISMSHADERRTSVVVKKKAPAKRGRPAKAVKRGPGRPKGSKNKTTVTKAPVKRGPGRPKGSTNTRKATVKNTKRNVESTAGRHILSEIDYNETDGWNPREGSAPDVILDALRRTRGDREKAFARLVGRIGDFVGPTMQDGTKRSKANREAMLRYRIARTDWDFAVKTGQHESATDRVKYGTGGTGNGTYKPKKSRKAPAVAPKRRGRPPGSKNKPKVTATKAAPKRRGRPPGSKNRTTAARTTRKPAAKRTMKRR